MSFEQEATSGSRVLQLPFEHIQTDFEKIQPGDWFFPMTLKGYDQHSLIPQALRKGIAGFVFESYYQPPMTCTSKLEVSDLRQYLYSLAREKRKLKTARTVVVTGSVGKTSVKELTGAILKPWLQDQCHISPENQNTKIALATQILRLPSQCKMAVFEMGARKSGDFSIPVEFLQPQVAALLNIGTAHVGEFGSIEKLVKEKLSILKAPSARTLVIPSNDSRIMNYARETGKQIISFGHEADPILVSSHIRILSETTNSIQFSVHGQSLEVRCGFQSSARALNVAAAVAIAIAIGTPTPFIRNGLQEFSGVARRFELFDWEGVQAIDDAFNASPESLKAGLQFLHQLQSNKKMLLVLGSMLELGTASTKEHNQAAREIFKSFGPAALSGNLGLVTIGVEARNIAQESLRLGIPSQFVQSFDTALQAKETVLAVKNSYDLVYFKGSKSIQLQEIFNKA